MKPRHLLPAVFLVSALGVMVVCTWSQEKDKPPGSKAAEPDYLNLNVIFSLIENDVTDRTALEPLAKAYESKAKMGDREAQFKIGAMYLEGLGVRTNYGKAWQWFSAAGGRDHPLAQLADGLFCLKCRDDDAQDYRTRQAAIESLGKIGPGSEQAIGLLKQEMARDWPLNAAAAVALGRIGERGVPILIEALASKDVGMRRSAAEGLSEAGEAARPAIPKLTAALEDDDPMTRQHAGRALNRLRAKEASK